MRRLLLFRQWPILPKIMAISVLSVGLMSAIIPLLFAPQIEQKMLEAKEEGLRNVVDVAFGIIHEYDALAREGQLEPGEAQARAAQRIRGLRYGEQEYFWINDVTMKMVMHPVMPELEGQDVAEVRDPDGKYLFKEFVAVTRGNGAGVVGYLWPRPGDDKPARKLSYVRLFEPWGWILGSGIYVDDVARDMGRLRALLFAGNVLFAGVTLIFAVLIGTGITRPLKKVIDGLKAIAGGKGDVVLNSRIDITSIDEIGVLSSEFNGLMESIGRLSAFKKAIEDDETVEDVYRRMGETFSGELGLSDCRIYEVDGSGSRMIPVFPGVGTPGETPCDPEVAESCDLCKAKRTGHVISSLAYPSACRRFRAEAGKEHCCMPLVVGGGAVGVVQCVFDGRGSLDAAKDHEPSLLKVEQYIKESLPVIETKRLMKTLREATLRDPLTGLHNRRYLQECTEQIVAGSLRRGKRVGLVMCDLDHFKQVNDVHGHAAGDHVLKESSALIRRSVRESDIVIRFGGEEFLVVLVDINDGEAIAVAEKIREKVQAATFKLAEGTISNTISLGVSEFPTDTSTFGHCIKFADVALFKAKEAGRNRSVRFTADTPSEGQG